MSDDLDARMGETAALLKRDSILDQVLGDSEEAYLTKLLACAPDDDLGRFRYAEAIKVVRKVGDQLDFYIQNGKVAARSIGAMNRQRPE